MNELELFDLAPKEKTGEIQKTEIEYLIIAFSENKKKEFIKMLEILCDKKNFDVYADLLFKIVKEKYEENRTGL
jgi:hypothetical protein